MKPAKVGSTGVRLLNCHPMVAGDGFYAFVRWCAIEMDWLRHLENPRRALDVWVLAGSLANERDREIYGMASASASDAVRELSALWFRGGDVFLPLDTLCDGPTLAETFVHELRHVIDFVSGEWSQMTREQCEARAYGAEAEFWRRVPRREAFRRFEALAAPEVRASLKALVRRTAKPHHVRALEAMHLRATIARCMEAVAAHGLPNSDEVFELVVSAAKSLHASGVRYDAAVVTESVVEDYVILQAHRADVAAGRRDAPSRTIETRSAEALLQS